MTRSQSTSPGWFPVATLVALLSLGGVMTILWRDSAERFDVERRRFAITRGRLDGVCHLVQAKIDSIGPCLVLARNRDPSLPRLWAEPGSA